MLADDGVGAYGNYTASELYDEITTLHEKLDGLGKPPVLMPEIVDSTNALRTNEYLKAKNDILAQLVSLYAAYSDHLTSLTGRVMEVQSGLVQVLRMQSEMIADGDADAGSGRSNTVTADTAGSTKSVLRASKRRPAKKPPKTANTRRGSRGRATR